MISMLMLDYLALIRLTRTKASTAAFSLALFIYYLYLAITPTVLLGWIIGSILATKRITLGGAWAFLQIVILLLLLINIPLYFGIRRWVRGWWRIYQQEPGLMNTHAITGGGKHA